MNRTAIEERIARAGGDPAAVTIVAVTKEQPVDAIDAALSAGLADLGENRPEALAERAVLAPNARWHLLGQIQRRKV
ncbi:MAG: hypothetical protein Q8K63_06705, partial [Acidimicrobiales bacterium]|nr:hypothetical protein [Acidimicrobiales bacterium]